ncbi:hypothetical protein [Streptomyces sp. NPDC055085]
MLGGQNISDWVSSFSFSGKPGDVYRFTVEIPDDPQVIDIDDDAPQPSGSIKVRGAEINHHVSGYEYVKAAGKQDVVRLHIQADTDILSINGTHPWEDRGPLIGESHE